MDISQSRTIVSALIACSLPSQALRASEKVQESLFLLSDSTRVSRVQSGKEVTYSFSTSCPSGEAKIPISAAQIYNPGNKNFDISLIPFEDWSCLVTPYDPYINLVARTLTNGVETREQKISILYSFVYKCVDYEFSAFFSFPLETLVSGKGGCAEKSILFASLCQSIDIDCGLAIWKRPKSKNRHALCLISGDFKGWNFLDN